MITRQDKCLFITITNQSECCRDKWSINSQSGLNINFIDTSFTLVENSRSVHCYCDTNANAYCQLLAVNKFELKFQYAMPFPVSYIVCHRTVRNVTMQNAFLVNLNRSCAVTHPHFQYIVGHRTGAAQSYCLKVDRERGPIFATAGKAYC